MQEARFSGPDFFVSGAARRPARVGRRRKIERIFRPWQPISAPVARTTQTKTRSRGGRLRVALKKASIKRAPEPLAPKRNSPRRQQRKNNGAKAASESTARADASPLSEGP